MKWSRAFNCNEKFGSGAATSHLYGTTTHHTSSGVELPVRNAAEVAAAAPVVLGAVSDGPKRVQQNLQRVEGRADHQLLPVQMETHNGRWHLADSGF